ncbi:3-hydroxyacyl-CoA dehydrogenase [Xylophilus sp. Kf1]|nr:3-hydroxyacyl-CoA dehydrogenase [Xylophilus sp. Kf1]
MSGSIAAIGAGRMGRSIAAAFALAGHRFDLIDLRPRQPEAWAALQRECDAELQAVFRRLEGLGLLQAGDIAPLTARVRLVGQADAAAALAGTGVLFEAVPETLPAKREAFAEACRHLPADAIVASTSSTMLPGELAGLVAGPQRFLNAHWLNPAYLIPLVEVAPHAGTDPAVLQRLLGLLERAGKKPVLCSGQPGYIVPRLQVMVMNEAARMIEQGAATAADIDTAIRYGFGPRYASMGVAEFLDFGGVDILFHASAYLAARLGDSRYACPPIVERMMRDGELGMKTGQGFYPWDAERAGRFQQDALERLVRLLRLQGVDPVRPPPSDGDAGAAEPAGRVDRADSAPSPRVEPIDP